MTVLKPRQFASDNYAGICPEAFAAMAEANSGHEVSYGDDSYTEKVSDRIRELFEINCEVYFVFNGTSAFQNGGVACLSCHNVAAAGILGGGTVGKDLSGAYSSMGEAGLSAILKSAPFPAMKAVYGERPLSESEAASLVTFLKDAGSGSANTSRGGLVFILIGIGGAFVIVLIMQLVWRQRLSAVRRPLVKGVTK